MDNTLLIALENENFLTYQLNTPGKMKTIYREKLLSKCRKKKLHYQIAERNRIYMEETSDEICYLNNSIGLLQLIRIVPDQDHEVYTASKV